MELLAPAGTFECVRAAIDSGADAVYFAGQSFGARSFAGNLTDDEVFAAADYCHLRGCRAYVTVNTLVFDKEIGGLENFVRILTSAGVDGVIVQDLGVLRLIRGMSPDLELHASTQMTVHSADGVKALEKLGISRVVLSRELSEDNIREIISSVSAEIEVFGHGAMCMSYSGQCLASSVIGGRSGNRGKCAQPCRLAYSDGGGRPKHYLSLKDMSYAKHIKTLMDMGVASLKIEGRMKSAAYVSAVVSVYRRLMDEGRQPTEAELDSLNRIFYRGGLTDGYFTNNTGKSMFAFDKPDNPYLKNDGKAELPCEKQTKIKISAVLSEGEYPKIKLACGDVSAEIDGRDLCMTAENKPLTAEGAAECFKKLGGTPFRTDRPEVTLHGRPYLPVSALNALRRTGVEALQNEILKGYRDKRIYKTPPLNSAEKRVRKGAYTCSVINISQYRAVRAYDFERIVVPLHTAEKHIGELTDNADRLVIAPPVIIRGADREKYKERMSAIKAAGFKTAEVSTLDALDITDGFIRRGGYRLNITNSYAADEALGMGLRGICFSTELNTAQLRDISPQGETEAVVYGHIPLMITENCILKNMDKCPCDGIGYMTDRTGRRFPIIRDGDICRSVVLNPVPLYMADKPQETDKINSDCLRLMFTIESADRCRRICDSYMTYHAGADGEYTRLQMLKGALL